MYSNLNPYFLSAREASCLFVLSKISVPSRFRTCALNYLHISLVVTSCLHEAVRCCYGKYLLILIFVAVIGIIIIIVVAIRVVVVIVIVNKSTSHSHCLTISHSVFVYPQCLLILMDFSNIFTSQQ